MSPTAGITALDLTRGGGLNPSAAGGTFSSSSWGSPAAAPPSGDTEYFSFGFTVDSLTTVNLTTLEIRTRSSGTGPGTLGLFWSGDGFASSLDTFNQAGTASGTGELASTVDLSSLTPVTNSTVEFRIIELGNTRADGTDDTANVGTFRLSNFNGSTPITLSGDIAVIPEPTSALSLLVLLTTCSLRRRRRLLVEH